MKLFRVAALCAALLPTPALACASCGCTFTSDWLSQGLVTQPGSALSLRWDYVPQTQLRSGTDKVDTSKIALPANDELEQRTLNSYVTLAFDHQFANDWGIDVALPFITRPHSTISDGDVLPSHSTGSGFGDMKLTARWQGLSTPGGLTGLQFGLVLPTGAFHRTFSSGPEQGELIDRGLQPGTGTVQANLGVYHLTRLGNDFTLSLQVQGQTALNARQDYRPGSSIEGSAAVQFIALNGITPSIEINARASAKDSGLDADVDNSGGEQVYISPGLSAKVAERVFAFAMVQVPVYQRVNGLQLVPRVTTSVGLQTRF